MRSLADCIQKRHRLLAPALACLLAVHAAAGRGDSDLKSVRARLEALAKQEGFRIRGGQLLAEELAPDGNADSVSDEIKNLLAQYNYYVVAPKGGRIKELIITSRLTPRSERPLYNHVKTIRVGSHHQVEATLTGPDNVPISVNLVVDTGASTIVLPASQAGELGFALERLPDGTAKTAGGTVPVKVGTLSSVKVGNLSASNVQVNFLPDDRLGDTRLLGMSFLDRFKFTLDDARQELILLSR